MEVLSGIVVQLLYGAVEVNMDRNGTSIMSSETVTRKEKRGISGSTLKLVAIFTMLIDHTAATILDNTLIARGMNNLDASNTQAVQQFVIDNGLLYYIDMVMRLIGRVSFPIFCFLLVEGFLHTRNVWKYAFRLAVFAFVSEIPFDLAFHKTAFYMQYQNVFFTLLIGLLVMIGFQIIAEKARDKKWLPALAVLGAIAVGCSLIYVVDGIVGYLQSYLSAIRSTVTISMGSLKVIFAIAFSIIALIVYVVMGTKTSLQRASIRFADLAVLVAGMLLAEVLMTDYSGLGVLTIAVMYALRKIPFRSMLGGCIVLTIMSTFEFTSFFDLILIRFYNGKRGINLRYVFYAFYPVHLLILYLICYMMKII